MRYLTIRFGEKDQPALQLDEDRALSLPDAFALGQGSGLISSERIAPASMLDVIAGGEAMRRNCVSLHEAAADPQFEPAILRTGSYTILAPIPRPTKNVFCVGKNYAAHVSEGARAQKIDAGLPEYPVYFTKPPTSVIGPDAAIRLDARISTHMDYEVELAVIIGRAGRDIPAGRAADHIFGFTILNDITARDVQRRHGGQFFKGKGLDTSCPFGPAIVTLDELPNFDELAIRLSVNGELRQDGNTRDMIFPIPELIESLSAGITLEPGDILATGTPSGVGYAMDPPNFLAHGDRVTCEIEGIGSLTNVMADVERENSAG
ncbi:MAG TPA: fumarylacetoacetate hydrolase family protein [Afifellaceae bacterium]|nr:fumarylacetoacetate hydrolase family protein [Afifellaceae bacterium]